MCLGGGLVFSSVWCGVNRMVVIHHITNEEEEKGHHETKKRI